MNSPIFFFFLSCERLRERWDDSKTWLAHPVRYISRHGTDTVSQRNNAVRWSFYDMTRVFFRIRLMSHNRLLANQQLPQKSLISLKDWRKMHKNHYRCCATFLPELQSCRSIRVWIPVAWGWNRLIFTFAPSADMTSLVFKQSVLLSSLSLFLQWLFIILIIISSHWLLHLIHSSIHPSIHSFLISVLVTFTIISTLISPNNHCQISLSSHLYLQDFIKPCLKPKVIPSKSSSSRVWIGSTTFPLLVKK